MPSDLFASFSELLNFVSGVCLGALLTHPLLALRGYLQQRQRDKEMVAALLAAESRMWVGEVTLPV
jgi:hypothetical protein